MKGTVHSLSVKHIIVVILLWLPFAASAQTLQIDSLKANYVEGFMEFVKINKQVPPSNARIAVIQDQNLAQYLEQIVSQNTQNEFQVERITTEELSTFNCNEYDVIFVGAGQRKTWSQFFEKTENCSTLIIGEEPNFLGAGGCIEFLVIKNRIRFRVDLENLEKRNIQLSSKLLKLAIE